jgi:uncharacterized protein DUF6188
MYGLPENFDASVFVGRRLEQVSFTANTLRLLFDEEVAITLEASFIHRQQGREKKEAVPPQSSELMKLLGRTVRRAEGRRDGTLTLEFDEGEAIVCLDDSPQYESFHIQIRDKELHV